MNVILINYNDESLIFWHFLCKPGQSSEDYKQNYWFERKLFGQRLTFTITEAIAHQALAWIVKWK